MAAGRRFGKSYLAAITLLLKALEDTRTRSDGVTCDLVGTNKEVYYIAPTFEQAKKIIWPLLKSLGRMASEGGIITSTIENVAVMTLVNGRRISIKGADRPDSLRGVGLSYAVLDEYAFMKPDVWDMIISPALADVEGEALFIGTPEGKNHFYELFMKAKIRGKGFEDYQAWQFDSFKNPTLNPKEIKLRMDSMSVSAAKQEFGASFNSGGGIILPEHHWKYGERPSDLDYYIAVDLAGFTTSGSIRKGRLEVLDEHSIAVVGVNQEGWYVEEIIHGHWDVRECALRLIKAYKDYRPVKLGIEKGITKQAVQPYLDDEMKRWNRYFTVWDLSHGGNHKSDRIRWALQGRLEKGRITLNKDMESGSCPGWQRALVEQANDFPTPIGHDDLIDSLAYIDQLADVVYYEASDQDDTWSPLDLISGF